MKKKKIYNRNWLLFWLFSKFTQKSNFKNIYGVEINQTCKNFINKKLKIPCYSTIEDIEKKILFDKIFLFYSFEYIFKPQEYLKNLNSILKKKGKIYIITQIKTMF